MTKILRHDAEAFPPDKQETIPNNHRVNGNCYQYVNGAKLRISDLPNDDSRGIELPGYKIKTFLTECKQFNFYIRASSIPLLSSLGRSLMRSLAPLTYW